jgi:adenylosuccinate synthase
MAKEYKDAGEQFREYISGPKEAMRQSEPYFTHASAWESWALGHEKWVVFSDNNREYLNKVRLHFGWDPLPVSSGKKTKAAPKSKKSR